MRTATTSPTTATASPTAAVVRTEARLFGRELGSLFWILLFPTILLTIIGLVPDFQTREASLGGQRVVDLYASVVVILAMIMASIMAMPSVIAGYRESGVLRRLRTTPMHPAAILGAQVGLHAIAVLVSLVLALSTARIVHDVRLPGSPGWYGLSVVLATAAAFAIGAVITSVSSSTRVVQTVGTIVFFPAMFTAGVWIPVQSMPDTLRTIVRFTPFGAASEALDRAASGGWPGFAQLGVMALWTALVTFLAARLFRWE